MSRARSGTRTHRSGSRWLSRCQAMMPQVSWSSRIRKATDCQSNGRWWPTSQWVACCNGMTCPATGSMR